MKKHEIRRLFGFLMAFCMALSCCAGAGGADMEPPGGATADALESDDGMDKPDALENAALFSAADDGMTTDAPKSSATTDEAAELLADTNRCGPNALWTLENGVLKITGTGEMNDFSSFSAPWNGDRENILSVNVDEGITYIGKYAFSFCDQIRTISIPATVRSIGDSAFCGCYGLTAVAIPFGVEEIPHSAFRFCEALKAVTIPESVTSIGAIAFDGCRSLEEIRLPESLRKIGKKAFQACSSLNSLTIPAGVVEIEVPITMDYYVLADSRLDEDKSGTTNIYVDPDNAVFSSVDGVLFDKDKTTLLEFPAGRRNGYVFPNGVKRVGDDAFWGRTIESVVLCQGLVAIGVWAFASCVSLTAITLPESLEEIGNDAFSGSSLREVTIPSGVVSIGDDAFRGTDLREITIPSGVASIGEDAFGYCYELNEIRVSAGNAAYASQDGALFNADMTELISCPGGKTGDYRIPDSVQYIRGGAFHGCKSIERLIIPNSVIGFTEEDAFYKLEGLSENMEGIYYAGSREDWYRIFASYGISDIKVYCNSSGPDDVSGDVKGGSCGKNLTWELNPQGVLTIRGTGNMDNYGGLITPPWDGESVNAVVIEQGVTGIGRDAFYRMNLKQISLSDTVSSIGACAFAAYEDELVGTATGSVALMLPASLTQIGQNALRNPSLMVSVKEGNSVFTVQDGALLDMNNHTLIWYNPLKEGICKIPDGVKEIASDAFYEHDLLTEVMLPEGLEKIGEWAFSSCSLLQSVHFPDSVKRIEDNAFSNCFKLESVHFGNGLTAIGEYVFDNTKITAVRLPNSLRTIGGLAFDGCKELTSVVLGNDVTNIGYGAFEDCVALDNITVPASLRSIADSAFHRCGSLCDIYYAGSGEQWKQISIGDYNAPLKSSTLNIHYNSALNPSQEALTGIRVSGAEGLTVAKNMPLDISALTVTAAYADGTSAAVSDYSLFGFNANRLGKQTVGVRYLDKETSFEITVVDSFITALSVASMPVRREYHKGDALDLSGLVLSATYSDYSTRTVTDGYSVSGYDANITGEQRVTIAYGGAQTGLTVSVSEPEMSVEAPRVSITEYLGGKTVALTSGTIDGTVWYTTDDSSPANSATRRRYNEPFTLTQSATVRACVTLNGVNSDIISLPVTVEQVSPLTADASGVVPFGTVITLRTETSGAVICYGFDAANITREYAGGIVVDRDMTVYAVAKKDGWRDSEVFQVHYNADNSGQTGDGVDVVLLSAEGISGALIEIPVFVYPDGDADIMSFEIAIEYDSEAFEFVDIVPAEGVKNLFTDSKTERNLILVNYNVRQKEETPRLAGGEIFTLYLRAKASSSDGEYAVTVNREKTDICSSASSDMAPLNVTDGVITLADTVNSRVSRVMFQSAGMTDRDGNAISSLHMSGTVRTSFTLENVETLRSDGDLVLNVVRVVFANDGTMLSWNIKTQNFTLNSAFSEPLMIPSGAESGSVKAMIVDDGMVPQTSAILLLGSVF